MRQIQRMKTTNSFVPFAWSMLLLLCSTPLFALDYSNSQLGFKATLPDGFDDVSKVMRLQRLISVGKLNESKTALVKLISIEDLGGPIGREDLSKRTDKPESVTLEKTTWKTFQVDARRGRSSPTRRCIDSRLRATGVVTT